MPPEGSQVKLTVLPFDGLVSEAETIKLNAAEEDAEKNINSAIVEKRQSFDILIMHILAFDKYKTS